jgi:hypothetical protein
MVQSAGVNWVMMEIVARLFLEVEASLGTYSLPCTKYCRSLPITQRWLIDKNYAYIGYGYGHVSGEWIYSIFVKYAPPKRQNMEA